MRRVFRGCVNVAVGVAVMGSAVAFGATDGSSTSQGLLPDASVDQLAATQTRQEVEEKPMRLSMEFENASLKSVLKTFSQQTGINVIAGSSVGDQPITLYLEDVSAMDALDQILQAGNLTFERPPGSEIYIVKPIPMGAQATQTITKIYRVKFARVSSSVLARAAAAFAGRTPFEATLAATSGGGGGGGGGGDVGIDVVLRQLLTSHGTAAVDGRTNSLILTDIPENFPRLEAALAALDIRTPQIMVNAEVIETSMSKLKDLGVQWGTGSEGDLLTFLPGGGATDLPGAGLTGAVATTFAGGGWRTRFPFSALGESRAPTLAAGAGRLPASTLSVNSFRGVLQALEQDTDTKILARPKILTLDNESAVIRLTRDEAIGFSTSSQAQTQTVGSTAERQPTGVVLVVTPQVNDHGYITMLVEPSVSKTVASNITAPTGQATPRDTKVRSSRTLVRIRNGDTLVVGGLIDRTEEQTIRRVPILADVPFLGEAFKKRNTSNSASELIVFVTPKIMEEPSQGQLAASAPDARGLREQEPSGARQESIEQTLNTLEQSKL